MSARLMGFLLRPEDARGCPGTLPKERGVGEAHLPGKWLCPEASDKAVYIFSKINTVCAFCGLWEADKESPSMRIPPPDPLAGQDRT